MGDRWSSRLSEYVDDELETSERLELERHLAECEPCRRAVAELTDVMHRARALEDHAPARDLWPDIHDRIRGDMVVPLASRRAVRETRRFALSMPQLAAAGVALVMAGAAGMWWLSPERAAPVSSTIDGGEPGFVAPAAATVGEPDVSTVIAGLQQVLSEHRGQLDSATVRVLEENLATIDRAIDEARAALRTDPANRYLNAHLAATLRMKVHLLNRAATLVSAAG
jgi:anti-sigma factor RsiW